MWVRRISCLVVCLSLGGCVGQTANDTPSADSGESTKKTTHPAHPSHGPHGGHLVELGNEEYHAEIQHDDESITFYVLDSNAAGEVPIAASEITINCVVDGAPKQYSLKASATEENPEGSSSRFTSANAELLRAIEQDESNPKLVLNIKGKSYRGTVDLSGEHEGHSH